MATYKETKGATVQTKDSDPNLFIGTWSSGTSINTARGYSAAVGDTSDALVFGGRSPSNGFYAINESYDGSSWTEVGDLNTGRRNVESAGTASTAALAYGGFTPPYTAVNESWNGSAWTEVADLNTARSSLAGGGTTTSALAINGDDPGPAYKTVESWDGSSWT